MFDDRLLFALILSGLLAFGAFPAGSRGRTGTPTLSTPAAAVAPIEVEPETHS
jgi:hypothetical protein